MNIDEYRALKAQELEEANQPEPEKEPVQEPVADEPKQDDPQEPANQEATPDEPKDTEPEVIEVEIDGQKVPLDELKNGYLRQSDYTKKTQEIARQRKEAEEALAFYNELKKNPQAVEQIKKDRPVPRQLDPATAKVMELEEKLYDMMLEKEIETLQSKYSDFEVREVLTVAHEKGITNLEDAYLISKAKSGTSDLTAVKEQLRKEVLAELERERSETSTIISTHNDAKPVTPKEAELSSAEVRVAKNMGLSPKEYAKWRDTGK